jgi:hypothetical protein
MSRRRNILRGAGWLMVALGAAIVLWGARGAFLTGGSARTARELTEAPVTPSATPTRTPEPIVPTATPTLIVTKTPKPTSTPQLTSTPRSASTVNLTVTAIVTAALTLTETGTLSNTVTLAATPTAASEAATVTPTQAAPPAGPAPSGPGAFTVPAGERFRLGVSLPTWHGNVDTLRALQVGWVMDWAARGSVAYGGVVDYAQTVRMGGGRLSLDVGTITAIAVARPGSTWLISNEPDVRWQDNVTPDVYARLYREAYQAIKAGDPSAVVAAGGISEPTELRLKYLDLVLQEYQNAFHEALPSDAWHIHNYMLREERDSWGVDIPPGLSENTGVLYGIDDSANLALFKSQIVRFRGWMADRGYRGQPLLISEFGIPMPADYGFPPDVVETFLRETWRYFLTATDPALGDPNDGGRLVQRWCWFSMEFPDYPTGDILDSEANRWTTLGYAWLAMVKD